MPYIDRRRRREIDPIASGDPPQNPGELNYALTRVIRGYLDDHGVSYRTFNDITGALTNCGLEFYRRIVAPYEDRKIVQNGDVFGSRS